MKNFSLYCVALLICWLFISSTALPASNGNYDGFCFQQQKYFQSHNR